MPLGTRKMAGSTLNNLTASIINSTLQTPGRNSNSRRASGVLRPYEPREHSTHPSPNAVEFVLGAPPPRRYGVAAPEDGVPCGIALIALSFSGSPPAVSATSSDELQPAAWSGGELRGSKSRKCSA